MTTQDQYAKDVAAIERIGVVPSILDVVCRATGMGFSAVARVTEDRWIACAVHDEINFGLAPGGELQIESTICNEIRQSGRLVVIDEVACDEAFREHHTPKQYGFQSYISVPITLPDGQFFGTLCAIDPRPARLNNVQTIETFKLFADLIGRHLDAQDKLAASEAELVSAAQRAELQHQFVAVLGHDLRNPLAAIRTGAKLLSTMGLESRASKLVAVIDRSSARISGLIDDVLDFTRIRLGGGISLTVREDSQLEAMLEQVVSEMRTANPDRVINCDFELASAVLCDRDKVGQLFSNLLANALTHGDSMAPVGVWARSAAGKLELSVSNVGAPIDPETGTKLFQPFVRGTDPATSHGLGLGLYIASEIARAHGGSIGVSSASGETTFTFVMPLGAPAESR